MPIIVIIEKPRVPYCFQLTPSLPPLPTEHAHRRAIAGLFWAGQGEGGRTLGRLFVHLCTIIVTFQCHWLHKCPWRVIRVQPTSRCPSLPIFLPSLPWPTVVIFYTSNRMKQTKAIDGLPKSYQDLSWVAVKSHILPTCTARSLSRLLSPSLSPSLSSLALSLPLSLLCHDAVVVVMSRNFLLVSTISTEKNEGRRRGGPKKGIIPTLIFHDHFANIHCKAVRKHATVRWPKKKKKKKKKRQRDRDREIEEGREAESPGNADEIKMYFSSIVRPQKN
ncbi:MAG: hypothetical protein BYD32DRAFT_29239 [Podila humilis]|nr:MAG: hypothetical protein BYD32DRAFT_29239 [Podila humilis]